MEDQSKGIFPLKERIISYGFNPDMVRMLTKVKEVRVSSGDEIECKTNRQQMERSTVAMDRERSHISGVNEFNIYGEFPLETKSEKQNKVHRFSGKLHLQMNRNNRKKKEPFQVNAEKAESGLSCQPSFYCFHMTFN